MGEIEVTTYPLDSAMRATACCGCRSSAASSRWAARWRSASARWRSPPTPSCPPRRRRRSRRRSRAAVWAGTVVVAMVLAIVLFFLIPVGLTSLIKGQLGSSVLFWLVEGVIRTSLFLGYMLLLSRAARPAARVRVPRRRAQDDLLLRGRPAAHARERPALLAAAPALRHELPAGGHGRRDLRVRADRAARLVLAGGHADARRAGDRRHLLRADQVRRAQPLRAAGCGR